MSNTTTTTTTGIAATYEVLAKLGEGGMGAVYKVHHRHLNQTRVIKVMRAQVGADEEFRRRFLAEAKLVAGLHHPQLVQLFEFDVAPSGAAYMVMEFIDGFTLKELLAASGPPSVGLSVEVARQSLEVLAYLHGKGLVHRDISPDNVMLTRGDDGRLVIKLIDLGIARRTETRAHTQLTAPGSFIGKVSYAAPEQFGMDAERVLDARSDLYSFGIVLYEILTGRYPIVGEGAAQILSAHLFKEPLAFAVSDPQGKLPEDLRSAVLRAMSKKPEDRHANAAEFGAELERMQPRFAWTPAEVDALFARQRRPSEEPADETARISAAQRELFALTSQPAAAASGELADGATWVLPARRASRRGTWLAAAAVALAIAGAALFAWAPWKPAREPGAAQEDPAALAAGLDFGAYRALVIGNNAYTWLPRLQTAVNDAQELAKVLESQYGFKVTTLIDAKRETMFKAIENVGKEMHPQDHLLIYYAGHGQLEAERAYWQPVDAKLDDTTGWLSTIDVSETLVDVRAHHVLVTADSCFSGAMAGPAGEQALPPDSQAGHRRWIEEMIGKAGRLVLTSGGFGPVPDVGGRGHSVFAHHLLDVLRENRTVLDGREVYDRVRERMVTETGRPGPEQKPLFGRLNSAGDEGGDFFFVPAAIRPAA